MRIRAVVLSASALALALLGSCGSTTSTTAATQRRVHLPPANARVDYQLGGAYRALASVRVVDRDRSDSPMHGRYNICYVNAFQSQAEEKSFWTKHHSSLLLHHHGRLVSDPGWPGEYVLDTSTAVKRSALAKIVGGWFAACAHKGFAAVEPDNLDSWTRSAHLLTKSDNVAFARLLASAAHHDGLAIAQKNTPQLGRPGRTSIHFDFAVAEECQVYRECGAYTKVYGRHVIEIEYTDNGRAAYRTACRIRGRQISVLLRDRDVVPRGHRGYAYAAC